MSYQFGDLVFHGKWQRWARVVNTSSGITPELVYVFNSPGHSYWECADIVASCHQIDRSTFWTVK
jgi:hypothetical protein